MDIEAMLKECVPGGSVCDPQVIADNIRAWYAEQPRADEARDAARMDWLCEHVVNVREPLLYGSHDMFWASPTDDDCGHEPSNLRAQIDAALSRSALGREDGDD